MPPSSAYRPPTKPPASRRAVRAGPYQEAEHWALRGLEVGRSDDLATQFLGLSVRSRVLARAAAITAALALAERVDRLASISDDPRDPGDAALNRAEITCLTGDLAQAGELIGAAIGHYQRKGATAYVTRARRLAQKWACRDFTRLGQERR